MAILEEANLLAERARHAKHRTHHVGTKLNEHELHEFEALAERRKQTPSELIRGKRPVLAVPVNGLSV
jgi:hypothetical protein